MISAHVGRGFAPRRRSDCRLGQRVTIVRPVDSTDGPAGVTRTLNLLSLMIGVQACTHSLRAYQTGLSRPITAGAWRKAGQEGHHSTNTRGRRCVLSC